MWTRELERFQTLDAKTKQQIPFILRNERFSQCNGIIRRLALVETESQWRMAKCKQEEGSFDASACKGDYRRTHGMPCYHELGLMSGDGATQPLTPDLFSRF
jgi:hypothetical protein